MADLAPGNLNNAVPTGSTLKETSDAPAAPIAAPGPQVTSEPQPVAPAPVLAEPPTAPEAEKRQDASAVTPAAPAALSSEAGQKEVTAAVAAPVLPSVEKPLEPPPSTEPQLGLASATTNGDKKEEPKPVSVEDINDEAMPDAKPTVPSGLPREESTKEPIVDTPAKPAQPVAAAAAEPAQADMSGALQAAQPLEKPTAQPTEEAAATSTEAPAPKLDEPKLGEKRKADALEANGETAPAAAALTAALTTEPAAERPLEKKAKIDEPATNGTGKKAGRPKKESKVKKVLNAVVGRTARKTRSQGAADSEKGL